MSWNNLGKKRKGNKHKNTTSPLIVNTNRVLSCISVSNLYSSTNLVSLLQRTLKCLFLLKGVNTVNMVKHLFSFIGLSQQKYLRWSLLSAVSQLWFVLRGGQNIQSWAKQNNYHHITYSDWALSEEMQLKMSFLLDRWGNNRRDGWVERGVTGGWRAGSQVERWHVREKVYAAWPHQWSYYP